MRAFSSVVLGLAVVALVAFSAQAQDEKKEAKKVTLKGTILCAKCELKETKKCANAIRVKEKDEDVVYYFDDKGAKEKYHKEICAEPKEGQVTGTVSEKDEKKFIKPAKDGVKFKKTDE